MWYIWTPTYMGNQLLLWPCISWYIQSVSLCHYLMFPSISYTLSIIQPKCISVWCLRHSSQEYSTLSHWLFWRRIQSALLFRSFYEIQQAGEPWYQTSVRYILMRLLITLELFWPSVKASEMDNPWVSVWNGPRKILDNQKELRYSSHQAIKNKSMPQVLCRGM